MSGEDNKGEKEKGSMNENPGSNPPSRPPTRSTKPLEDQQQIDPIEGWSESENAKKVEDILRTNIDGFESDIVGAKQQAMVTPGKETKIQAFKNKMKNYLMARPKRYLARQEKYPGSTQEQIYETLQDEDQYNWDNIERRMEKIQTQLKNFEQQDIVNKVRTKTRRTRTRQKGHDSSEDSLDDEDTGETSGQELVSERNERKRKVEKGSYKLARPDVTTKADKRVRSLTRRIAAEEAQMGIQTDDRQKILQTCLVTAIQRQTYNDTQIDTVFYPKVRLTKNNERLYDPNLVSTYKEGFLETEVTIVMMECQRN